MIIKKLAEKTEEFYQTQKELEKSIRGHPDNLTAVVLNYF